MKTFRLFGVALVLALAFSVAQLSGLTGMAPTAFAAYAKGHDNTTAPHTWTHADPNVADPPGNNRLGSNYYYLKAFASGPEVVCTVFSGGNWEIALEDAHKHVLAHEWPLTSGGQVYITNAHPGSLYMCRISDLGTTPARDYAQLDSGPVGAVTCDNEPGPIRTDGGAGADQGRRGVRLHHQRRGVRPVGGGVLRPPGNTRDAHHHRYVGRGRQRRQVGRNGEQSSE
jgi:hypothetical protein